MVFTEGNLGTSRGPKPPDFQIKYCLQFKLEAPLSEANEELTAQSELNFPMKGVGERSWLLDKTKEMPEQVVRFKKIPHSFSETQQLRCFFGEQKIIVSRTKRMK